MGFIRPTARTLFTRSSTLSKLIGLKCSFTFILLTATSLILDILNYQFRKYGLVGLNQGLSFRILEEITKGLGAKDAVPALVQALQHDDYWVVRRSATGALGEIGTPEALKAFSDSKYRL
ncbi:hypothetical protein CMK12_15855 [Candidatus Poribacteria bacterium]|nr:hypothetical protein [Candidatus Poribacteria bacterium]